MPVHGASISTRSARPARSASSLPTLLRGANLNIARAGAGEAVVDRRKAPLVGVGRVDLAAVLHRCGQRQRLAAGAGAKIDDLLARLGAGKERGKLRAFVLDLDAAFEKGRLGMNRRAFGIRRKTDAKPDRRPSRRLGVEMGKLRQRVFARADKRIDPQVERRTARQRWAFGRPLVAEDPRQIRIEPFRIIAREYAPARRQDWRRSSAARSASLKGAGA